MKRIHLADDIKPVTEFRANAAALIDQIRETKRTLVLTQRGYSAAVVLAVDEYERVMEELELLRDIHHAEQELGAGQGIPHEAALEQVLARLKR